MQPRPETQIGFFPHAPLTRDLLMTPSPPTHSELPPPRPHDSQLHRHQNPDKVSPALRPFKAASAVPLGGSSVPTNSSLFFLGFTPSSGSSLPSVILQIPQRGV